jgi:hypothetical protein
MTITSHLLEAFLKCPTKCWLRSAGEQITGGTFAQYTQTQDESYRRASGCASTGIPVVNHLSDIRVVDELIAVSRSKALFHLANKPFVVVYQAFDCLNDKCFGIAALLGSKAAQLRLQIGVETHFHWFSLGIVKSAVNIRKLL